MVERSYPVTSGLLPCPFCGGEAERFDDHDTGSTNEGGSCICCKRCNASTAMHFDRKENLVSSWNDRRRDAQAADIFKELGEPDHKLARWSHGAPAFEMWSRESIEAALLRVATQPLGVAQGSWECGARKQGTAGGNAPADCDWPGCGCDPAANKVLEAIDEAGFEITKKREPLPWDASSNYSYEPVETLAAEIYAGFVYDGPGKKPAWTPGGNSTKQNEARFAARRRLRAGGHTPSVTSTSRATPPDGESTFDGRILHEHYDGNGRPKYPYGSTT